jgi:hypothetical protein
MSPATGWTLLPATSVKLAHGEIHRFDCYPKGSVVLRQLRLPSNLDAALEPLPA